MAVAFLAAAKLGVLVWLDLSLGSHQVETAASPSVAAAPAKASRENPLLQMARDAVLEETKAQAAQLAQAAPAAQPAKPAPAAPAAPPDSLLSARELKDRADQLDRKEQALHALEDDLNSRTAKLQQLETTIKSMLDQANALKDEKMRHLIDVYTNMKAKQAASVLETLDESVAVKILAGMKGRQAGEILTYVSAKKAAKLSEALTKLQSGPDLPQNP